MIPLFLDLSASRVLVFGAGEVGLRKARHFISAARMTIVAEELSPEVFSFTNASIKQQAIDDMEREELVKLIQRHDIIITALSNEKENERLCLLAKNAGKLYNNATGEGNIRIPSMVVGAEYQIAITTEKSAPVVPAFIRSYLEANLPWLDNMVLLQNTLREELKKTVPDQARRAEILRAVIDDAEIQNICRTEVPPTDICKKYL
ncbi:MAG TPA: bifunctional precorrin-2 dehydrogenase/sirohydrochlorin ferrochelatase [Methanocorpusculum sp.]|nr:bifunctional precorrin-2 dehydrogenase/sirohydrochlorin ferrochelatase [Methanocorpusculum sp.]